MGIHQTFNLQPTVVETLIDDKRTVAKTKKPAVKKRAFSAKRLQPQRLRRNYFQPVSSAMAAPSMAGFDTVFTPAAWSAANFSSAVPLPPEMIAPA